MATYRKTRQKKLILQAIEKADKPVSAEQILGSARDSLPGIALTTVYRNLEQLCSHQIISRLVYPDGISRYRLAGEVHGHQIICLGCNRSMAINHCPLDCLEEQIAAETGYSIEEHKLQLYGYCPQCRRKEDKNGQTD